MSSQSKNEKELQQEIKQLKKQLEEAKWKEKPVTQNIANQHIIQGNTINNSHLNANVKQHGNSLKSVKINDYSKNNHHVKNPKKNVTDMSDAEFNSHIGKYVNNFIP